MGTCTIGSSEAIMLALLAHKRSWKKRRQAEGKPADRPNIVFSADVHTCWEKFARYFDGDVIEWKRPVEVEQVDFLGRPAVRVSGWWGNRTLVGGGPFRTYCFYEPSSERVYLLDISLFAPGVDKTALMRNLDAIAHTFSVSD